MVTEVYIIGLQRKWLKLFVWSSRASLHTVTCDSKIPDRNQRYATEQYGAQLIATLGNCYVAYEEIIQSKILKSKDLYDSEPHPKSPTGLVIQQPQGLRCDAPKEARSHTDQVRDFFLIGLYQVPAPLFRAAHSPVRLCPSARCGIASP